MNITNIANFKRKVYLFIRNKDGSLKITEDNSFYPRYYEPDNRGKYYGYDGTRLKQVLVSEPNDIPKQRSNQSFSSDVKFVNVYLIEKVDKLEPGLIKYLFLDIEVMASKEFPEPSEAKFPISCITTYNSLNKEYNTWWLPDYDSEETMLEDFCFYIHGESPDIIASWNSSFDYNYLHNRIKDFHKKISPVGFSRYGEDKDILYPAGISIVDYLRYFEKVEMREASYALDYIAQVKLDEKPWPKTRFDELSDLVKAKNINDVKRMVKLEEKYKLFDYYNEIRCLAKTKWEDLYYNSRTVEMLLFQEAKTKNIILPNKISGIEGKSFQGATRESEITGSKFNIGKLDLGSAYPSMIINFCLDPTNLDPGETEDNININGVYFRQNSNALLPSVAKKMLKIKNDLKKQRKKDKTLQKKYDGIKAVVNSIFGVCGNKYFRLYNNAVASTIAYLVRDLINYTRNRLAKEKVNVLYWDTDAVFVDTIEDISSKLNKYIQDWGKQYGKDSIDLTYDYEGYFDKIFFFGKCHYFGYLHGETEPEIKGIEIKRSSSSKYEAYFQRTLLDKMLNKENINNIIDWIIEEKGRIKTLPKEQIAFPCKLKKEYKKNNPIFFRAYENTKKINKKFEVMTGELFYYIYVKPIIKNDDVLAFKIDDNNFLDWRKHIDWEQVTRRNIYNKAEAIFEAEGLDNLVKKIKNPEQMGLF